MRLNGHENYQYLHTYKSHQNVNAAYIQTHHIHQHEPSKPFHPPLYTCSKHGVGPLLHAQGGTALHASSSAGLSTMVEQLVNGTFSKTANVHVSALIPLYYINWLHTGAFLSSQMPIVGCSSFYIILCDGKKEQNCMSWVCWAVCIENLLWHVRPGLNCVNWLCFMAWIQYVFGLDKLDMFLYHAK